MRSRSTKEYIPVLKWDAPGPYPTDELPSIWHFLREWSQDLVISTNNKFGSSRPNFNSSGDVGGDFLCYRRFYDEYSSLGTGPMGFTTGAELPPAPVGRPYYVSPQYAYTDEIRNSTFPLPLMTDRSELNALASFAISQVAPNKPEAALSSFLGELREGLPHAIGLGRSGRQRAQRVHNAGDEYLNVEFGWKPLVRDVQSFAKAVKDSDRILDNYRSGAGKLIKRSFSWPAELTISDPELVHPNITQVPTLEGRHYGDIGTGVLTRVTTSRIERWFSATFMYALPPEGTPQRWSAEANKLLGTNLDPEMLWQLAPWSWALDWAGNAGTLAENISLFNSDSLVMPWSYLMERKTIEVEYTWRSHSDRPYRTYPGSVTSSQKFTTVMKSRIKGTPYGFDVDWPEFTDNRLAILASLGISKS